MFRKCPRLSCSQLPDAQHRVRNFGRFVRSSDSRHIQRFHCRNCRRTFSAATTMICFGQKKRRLNHLVWRHLCTGDTLRRTARSLGVNDKTVQRKFTFLAEQLRKQRMQAFEQAKNSASSKIDHFQLDELRSAILSKCLPVNVALGVEHPERTILDYQVSEIPASGPLADISRLKYGPRPDHSGLGLKALLANLQKIVDPRALVESDDNPRYPRIVRQFLPHATHKTYKGKRGCIVGQGELKRVGFDPLFSLNHTAAMIRYGVSRLARRTWCTSKTIRGLENHLELYLHFHNRYLIQQN